jgi:hypothetical protein
MAGSDPAPSAPRGAGERAALRQRPRPGRSPRGVRCWLFRRRRNRGPRRIHSGRRRRSSPLADRHDVAQELHPTARPARRVLRRTHSRGQGMFGFSPPRSQAGRFLSTSSLRRRVLDCSPTGNSFSARLKTGNPTVSPLLRVGVPAGGARRPDNADKGGEGVQYRRLSASCASTSGSSGMRSSLPCAIRAASPTATRRTCVGRPRRTCRCA